MLPHSDCLRPTRYASTLEEVVNQFTRRVVHFHVEGLYAPGQIVEHHDGRDGDQQPNGGCNQRFSNTAGDGSQTGSVARGHILERVQNSHHGSEQSDEWRRGPDRSQATQTALQFGMDNSFRAFQGSLGGLDGLAGNPASFLVRAEFHQASRDDLRQVTLLVAFGDLDGFVNLAIAECASNGWSKCSRLFAGRVECHPAINHYADGPS